MAFGPGRGDDAPLPTRGLDIVPGVILTSSLGHRMKERNPLFVIAPMIGIAISLKHIHISNKYAIWKYAITCLNSIE
jgi:hypothetical protein